MPGLPSLPPELIASILDFVPSADLQKTTLSLCHILSYAFVPNWRRYLFYHVHLTTAEGVFNMLQHLEEAPGDAVFVRRISLATTCTGAAKVAADLIIILILMLPNLSWLSLSMGMNFTSKHLEQLLRNPMPNLQYLSLRLRPYMLESNYDQYFLSQSTYFDFAFFDSAFAILATWPSSDLLTVSVVLDPPVAISPYQPVVLYGLFNLRMLSSSLLLERTQAFRMRFPGCRYADILCTNTPSLPSLTLLDLSTSNVCVSDVHTLLSDLRNLRHLLLDRCGTLDEATLKDWTKFGYDCMMINSGLVLEELENERSAAHAEAPSPFAVGRSRREVSILPRASSLRTLALSAPPRAEVDTQRSLIVAFQCGWSEAVTAFNDRMRAARQSRSKGLQTLRFALPGEVGQPLGDAGHPMVVVDDDEFARLDTVMDDRYCPVVCLAGQQRTQGTIGHSEGCGHLIGWDIWEDTL